MKLVNSSWEHVIDLSDGTSTLLVIEDPICLRGYIEALIEQINTDIGPFVLSDEKKEYSVKEKVAVVTDPLQNEIVDKRITSKITSMMKSHMVGEDHYADTIGIISAIESYAEELKSDFPYELTHSEIDSASLSKLLGFSILVEYESKIDRLTEFANIMHGICGINSFFLVGMSSYYSEEELSIFLKECCLQKHNVVLLERLDCLGNVGVSKKVVIDKDHCEIF